MSQQLKRRSQIVSNEYSINEHESIRKYIKKDDENSSLSQDEQEIINFLPQITFQSPQFEADQILIAQVQSLQEEIEKCIKLKNYKNIPRILRKKLVIILKNNLQKKNVDVFQRLISILASCLSLQQISNNFFLQKALCDNLFELLNHYQEFVDSNCVDVLFNLLNIVESGGIKEQILSIIIKQCKKNINKCKRSVQDNQDNSDINKLSIRMKFKFIKLLYKIISDEIPEQELQSSSKNQALQNSAGSPTKILSKPAKSFQSQLIAEMIRWLQQEPLIASNVLKFLLSIESRQATIVKLCLLKNISLNEDSQLYFLDFLKNLFQQNPLSQGDIIHKVFQYINNCTRSLSYLVRLKASQILHYYPYFDENLLLRTIKLEQFQDYGKGGSSTPTKAIVTPTKSDQEKFSISHGYGAIVHLLEDEYNEVRKSALEIIQNFGLQNEQFGKESRDILFYMLNDENDSVRVKTIQGISNVLAQESVEVSDGQKKKLVTITNDEMDSLMFNLKEKVPRLRIVIYKLLGKVKLEDLAQLNMALDITLRNINEFGDDSYIFEMCKHIGENNSALIQKNICQILQIADILYVQEPHWKDKAHIYRVIMISNAFKNRDDLQKHSETLLPSYFLKQYDMMQDLMPKYFHPLYNTILFYQYLNSPQQSQLIPLKSTEEEKKKQNNNNESIDRDDEEIEIELQNKKDTKLKDQINETSTIEQTSVDNLLNILINNLSDISQKKSIFKVIKENANSQQQTTGQYQDQFKFIIKISKIAYLFNLFIKQISNQGLQTIQSIQSLTFQLLRIVKKIHRVQCLFIVDDQNQQIIYRLLFITLLQLPLLHMFSTSFSQSNDIFESINFIKTMTFIQEIIKEFQDGNNSRIQQNSQSISNSVRLPNNPFLLLHTCLEEGVKIAIDVQANPQRLSTPSTREPYFIRYRNFLNSLPYKLIFPKRDKKIAQQLNNQSGLNNTDPNIQIKLRKANIFVPKDDSVEIQSKYMAKTSFVAEVTHFLTLEERKNLQLLVEYSDSSYESMQLIEDDFVYLAESIHVINTNIFFQKINWTTESLANISINYLRPLSFFTRNTIQREIAQFLPNLQSQTNIPFINLLNTSCTLAKSVPFSLIIKSRII